MISTRWLLFVGTAILSPAMAGAAPQVIASSVPQVSLLELYTSEGCSSCPPAEEWLSGLTDDARLWNQIVPIALHVDYWDSLGWRDRFDSHAYTERQQQYAQHWGNGVIYTPEFVLNGREWSSGFGLRSLRLGSAPDVGRLVLAIDGRQINADFAPVSKHYASLELHVAVLAFGVSTRVGAGENAGHELSHDFLVVGYGQHALLPSASGFKAALPLPQSVNVKASRYALAAWVSVPGDPAPIQSTGGWLAAAQ